MPNFGLQSTYESDVIRSTCPYCGVGCGVVASRNDQGDFQVVGDSEHPANFGRLCSKGSALADTLASPLRLTQPSVDGMPTALTYALDQVAARMQSTIQQYGPDAIMFYVSGQLLTEDYYIANKLAKGFVGTNNIDSNSRLCMSSAVAGHKRAFGSDTVPVCYEDLELADLVVIVGSNMAWCHPVLFQRLKAAQLSRHTKVIVIDPRRTDTCDIATLHLPIKPGTDVALFLGLFCYLVKHNVDQHFLKMCEGYEHTRESSSQFDIATVSRLCDIAEDDVIQFFKMFSDSEKVVTAFSMGVNQSTSGTDKVNSIINCHLVTGRIGKPGAGPLSLTGQPNAMGGREVGALSNLLAAHFDLTSETDRQTVGEFWNSPHGISPNAGIQAPQVADKLLSGQIKFIWIMATNPVVSLTEAHKLKAGLRACETVVVSDCSLESETLAFAHIKIPVQGWGEKEGTVTNSERRISRQRRITTSEVNVKPDWWVMCHVANRLGYLGFDYENTYDIFKEHIALSNISPQGGSRRERSFQVPRLKAITLQDYQKLAPFQWPNNDEKSKRFFSEGGFYHANGVAKLIPLGFNDIHGKICQEFPMLLNTGRLRDQWHTMTRTSLVGRLNTHAPEPFVYIHPDDALKISVAERDIVQVESRHSSIEVRVQISDQMRTGELFIPMHWNTVFAKNAGVNRLVSSVVDPISGQPEFKATPVRMNKTEFDHHGFVLFSNAASPQIVTCVEDIKHASGYWARISSQDATAIQFAGQNMSAVVKRVLEMQSPSIEVMHYCDEDSEDFRLAVSENNRVVAIIFNRTNKRALPSIEWLRSQLSRRLSHQQYLTLLAASPGGDFQDHGPIVCSCFNVGKKQIQHCIDTQENCSPADIGTHLKAGTNCGSCVPELKRMIAEYTQSV